jgi:hypothetical protein
VEDSFSDDDFFTLVGGEDSFKLAILGLTAIEDEIEKALDNAFAGGFPSEIRGFSLKLTLAVALGIVASEHGASLSALAKLRNQFAHGEIRELSKERASELASVCEVLLLQEGEEPPAMMRQGLRESPPIWTLRVIMMASMTAIRSSANAWLQRRVDEERILSSHRAEERRRIQEAALKALRSLEESP